MRSRLFILIALLYVLPFSTGVAAAEHWTQGGKSHRMYSPVSVAGPDQRRKQLMAKLGQQAQTNMAGRGSVTASVGSSFRPSVAHGLVKAASTQGTNILPGVLARLGILGNAKADEVSQGYGAPIGTPHGTPLLGTSAGTPIPAAPGQVQLPASAGSDPQAGTLGGIGYTNLPAPYSPQTPLGNNAAGLGNLYGAAQGPGVVGQNAPQTPTGSLYGSATGIGVDNAQPIALGGGHFFDPASGQIIFNPSAGGGAGRAIGTFLG